MKFGQNGQNVEENTSGPAGILTDFNVLLISKAGSLFGLVNV